MVNDKPILAEEENNASPKVSKKRKKSKETVTSPVKLSKKQKLKLKSKQNSPLNVKESSPLKPTISSPIKSAISSPIKSKRIKKEKKGSPKKLNENGGYDEHEQKTESVPKKKSKKKKSKFEQTANDIESEFIAEADQKESVELNENGMNSDTEIGFVCAQDNETNHPSSIDEDEETDEAPIAKKIPYYENEAESSSEDEPETDFNTKCVKLFDWMLLPVKSSEFLESYWESKPLHIARYKPSYFKNLLTSSDIDKMLRQNSLYFGRNIDIVNYVNGQRVTENPDGRAKASIVWDAYSTGHSIRILNPQTYKDSVHILISTLQEYFGTMVGANVYLTPPGAQGFAPHYDDIEAFVFQLEGSKTWKLYNPRHHSGILPRYSSKDFDRDNLGDLLIEKTLKAGDTFYFPRGIVHEATTSNEHSLHLTVSTYQRTSYADLLEKAIPAALEAAIQDDVQFRRGLPIGYLKHMGVVNKQSFSATKKEIKRNVHDLFVKLFKHIDLDKAADDLGRKFMYEAMPPFLEADERECTSHLDGAALKDGGLINRSEIEPDTRVRLVRYYAVRLVIDKDGQAILYYSTENAKVYQQEEEESMAIDIEMCPIIEHLQNHYPEYIKVDNLPLDDLTKKLSFITDLWDYGIVVTEEPLNIED